LLGQKWHPDKCAGAGSSGGGGADAAKARFQKIQAAYAGNQSAPTLVLYYISAAFVVELRPLLMLERRIVFKKIKLVR
jgi:hypothetical protein